MKIIAHRGYWTTREERNSEAAFEKALSSGFGIETDIRDCGGKLVISHDMPSGAEPPAERLFELYGARRSQAWLALNIKADGLQAPLKEMLTRYAVSNYFVFDMSVPDTLGYLELDMAIFVRRSEYEAEPPFYGQARGVWMDCFRSDWFDPGDIERYLADGKYVCLVSPELHNRPHAAVWERYKQSSPEGLMLCTDYPGEASSCFGA
jgi:hypothetical protein